MSTEFALDLRAARRKAGYTQGDIAHLLDHHQSHISDLEQGQVRPTLSEIMKLSLVYGRSFEQFFATIMSECHIELRERLKALPKSRSGAPGTYNRASSLMKLRERLKAENATYGGA